MRTSSKHSITRLLFLVCAAVTPELRAQTGDIVWQQSINFSNFSDWGPSQRSQSGSVNAEIADDFDVVGTITRIDVNGFGVGTRDAAFAGVYVHFYAYGADNTPAALQAEYFIPAGDARILNPDNSSDFRIALGSAFQASGKHFVSVQVLSDGAWYWRSADENAPRGPALYYRNPSAGQPNWSHTIQNVGTANSDTAFTLRGTRNLTTPIVSGLSTTTLAQAGRLKISGSGFGDQQGAGLVRIGGVSAPVSQWTDTSITAYVSDNSPVGPDTVQVVTSGGVSNTLSLQVVARPAVVGHVRWRFMADDLYIIGRPAVGADGTVYAAGVKGHLYALTPAGGVKWILTTGPANVQQPVSVGLDGTIYFSSVATIYAVNPDGTLKWTFSDPGSAIIFAGPTAGPDGNIYACSDDVNIPNGLGAFVLSPAGVKLSNLRGFATRFGYSNIEVVFASNHWYFTNNASGAVAPAGSLWAFDLGGTNLVWHQPAEGQPRVQPGSNIVTGDGNRVHPGLKDFDPAGNLIWSALGEGNAIDAQTSIDVGSDGSVYLGSLTYGVGRHLTALNANGTLRWQFRDDGIASSPGVSPLNTLVLYSAYDIGAPSHVNAVSTAGQLLWTENLPAENGGYVRALSTPRFSTDGAAAYVGMDVNDGAADPYSYLYAFITGDTAAVTPTSVVSRKTHGAAGPFDIDLPRTGNAGIECRSGGVSSDYQLVFTFPTAVTLSGALVTPEAGKSGSMAGPPSISANGTVVTLNLTNVTDAQTLAATLSGVSNGTSTNDITIQMRILVGDTNGTGAVNASDIGQTKSQSGQPITNTNFRSDVTANGSINASDVVLVKSHSGS